MLKIIFLSWFLPWNVYIISILHINGCLWYKLYVTQQKILNFDLSFLCFHGSNFYNQATAKILQWLSVLLCSLLWELPTQMGTTNTTPFLRKPCLHSTLLLSFWQSTLQEEISWLWYLLEKGLWMSSEDTDVTIYCVLKIFKLNILFNHSIHWVVPASSASNLTHSANKLMGGLVNSTCNLSLPKGILLFSVHCHLCSCLLSIVNQLCLVWFQLHEFMHCLLSIMTNCIMFIFDHNQSCHQ